jgi:2-polyprenyl-3-methyl-5-hydroxy-6-metoxy-1,4-benzoquinol methylase
MRIAHVRTSENPVAGGARRWLERVNHRHPWNHNEHFHGWILRNLPTSRRSALDVGCGEGVLLAKLASSFTEVTGVDADRGMVEAASRRLAANAQATVHLSTFVDFTSTADNGAFDLITMVAVLHHLDLHETLQRIPRLLSPGGRLLIVGLARVESPTDVAIDLVSVVLNPLVGLIKHPRTVRKLSDVAQDRPAVPVKDPTTALADVALVARAALPGCSVRRRLFFRYSLCWDKPA